MFSQKILIPLFLLTLGSCSIAGVEISTPGAGNKDFSSMYQSYVSHRIDKIRDFSKDLGYMDGYETAGALHLATDIPAILSGTIHADYSAKVHGQDTNIIFSNPTLAYETLMASGAVMAKELDLITNAGDAFFRYDGLEGADLMGSVFSGVIEKYKNTWLSVTQKDMEASLSGATEEDIVSYKISQALTHMSLSDIEYYLKKYPLFQEQKDLGMSGSLHNFEVVLSKENIEALVAEFTQKATGKEMTTDARQKLRDSLKDLSIGGALSLDSNDTERIVFDGGVTAGSGETARLILDESKDSSRFSFGSSGSLTTISSTQVSDGHDFSLVSVQDGKEFVHIDGKWRKDKERFSSLDINFSAPEQGLTVTLNHKSNADGTFEGKLNGGVGNITWKGKIENNELRDFHVTGAMIGTSLTMDLAPGTGGLLHGPLLVKSGDTTVVSATVGLRASQEEFSLIVDVASPEDSKVQSHGEISITGKRTPWSGSIEIPTESKKFQEFADEISVLSPKQDVFTEIPEESGTLTPIATGAQTQNLTVPSK